MPIVVYHGDPAALAELGYQAGQATGRADRLAQQRQIDAQFVSERLGSRERMAELQSVFNMESAAGGGRAQGPAPASAGSPVQTVLSEEGERLRSMRNAQSEAMGKVLGEQSAKQAQHAEMLAALDRQYEGREKDMTYFTAKDQILSGKGLDGRLMYSLGIESGSEAEARARREAKLAEGQADGGAEKRNLTATERTFREALDAGRAGDLADVVGERSAAPRGSLPGETGPLTSRALTARNQVDAFVREATDAGTLRELYDALGEQAGADLRDRIQGRISEIEREEIELKAPAAYEQAVEGFKATINAMQKKAGGPVPVTDQRRVFARVLQRTAEAHGLGYEAMSEWVRATDANRRAAEAAVRTVEERMIEAQQGRDPAQGSRGVYGSPTPPPGTREQPRPQSQRPLPDWMTRDPGPGFVPGLGPQASAR